MARSPRHSPEQLLQMASEMKQLRKMKQARGAVSGAHSDTYAAGLFPYGGGGYSQDIAKYDTPTIIPMVAQGAQEHVRYAKQSGDLIARPHIIEDYRNFANRALAKGDADSAIKLADAAKFFEIQKELGSGKKSQYAPTGQYKKPSGKKLTPKSGDGYVEPKEHNPLKRALGMVLGAPGVQQALKAVRMPYSYVASHISDIAQEAEQGDVGGMVGALGRGVGLGVVGEIADAAQGKGFDVAGILNSYENEKNRKDFWKQTGVGEYLQRGLNKHHWDDGTFLNNKWFKRGVGLAGDIGLDPLTYLTAGTPKLAGTSAEVATRITEAGSELAAREGAAAAAAKAAEGASEQAVKEARTLAEEEAKQFVRETANTVIQKGKNRLSKADVARLFPEEKVAGGLAWRVPFTGRVTRGAIKAATGGKVEIEEKLIPLLSKDITNPMQRVLSKPARALGASGLSDKLVGKFGGELGSELRGLIRSGDPESVYKGLGIKRALNVMRSRASSSVHVLPEDLKQLFPDATDLLVGQGEHVVGPNLSRLWVKHIAPAIKGREKEIMQAIESGNTAGVEGADKVINFYRAARNALTKQGAVFGNIGDEYIPRIFTEEGRQALQDLAGDVPEGTTAIDPKVAFMNHRATLEELGVRTQDEARALLETAYGKNLKGGQVFEPDLHKIASQYIRLADQQQGRQALLQELTGWGIALKPDEMEHYIGIAGEKSPKVVANQIVNRAMKSAPLAKKRAAQRAIQLSLEDAVAAGEAPLAGEATDMAEGLSGRLRTPTGAPVTPEEQAAIDALSAGVSGKPIPASEVLRPQYTTEQEAWRAYWDASRVGDQQASDDAFNAVQEFRNNRTLAPKAQRLIPNEPLPTEASGPLMDISSHGDLPIQDTNEAYAARVQAARDRLDAWGQSVSNAKQRMAELKAGVNQDLYSTLDFLGYEGSLDDSASVVRHLQAAREAFIESGTYADRSAARRLQNLIDDQVAFYGNAVAHQKNFLGDTSFVSNPDAVVYTDGSLDQIKAALSDETLSAGRRQMLETEYARQGAGRIRGIIEQTRLENKIATGGAGNKQMLDQMIARIEQSPHSEELLRQLEFLGKQERLAINAEERAMEGIGRYENLAEMGGFDPTDASTWGNNFDPKQVADDERGVSWLARDVTEKEMSGRLAHKVDQIEQEIAYLEDRLKTATSDSEARRIANSLLKSQEYYDVLHRALWNEGGETFLEKVASGSREAGLVSQALKRGMSLDELSALETKRNVLDVYLGVQRALSDTESVNLAVGDQAIRDLDALQTIAPIYFNLRSNDAKSFAIPNKEVQYSLLNKTSAGLPRQHLADALMEQAGAAARNQYNDLIGRYDSELAVLRSAVGDPEAELRSANISRQKARLINAVLSGDQNEFTATVLISHIETVGADESVISQRALSDVASATNSGDERVFLEAINGLKSPAHPMGGPSTYVQPEVPEFKPPFDPEKQAIREQQAWDRQYQRAQRRVKQLQEAKIKRGHWTRADYDEITAIKKRVAALGERPAIGRQREILAAETAARRSIEEYTVLTEQANEMLSSGRIIRLPDGSASGMDVEARGLLARMKRIEADDPWKWERAITPTSKRQPWELDLADARESMDIQAGMQHEMTLKEIKRSLSEAEAPLVEEQKAIAEKMAAAKEAGDTKTYNELRRQHNALGNERKRITRAYSSRGSSSGLRPASAGEGLSPAETEARSAGAKLAEKRIAEGKTKETLNEIQRQLDSNQKIDPLLRHKLEGGRQRLLQELNAAEKADELIVESRKPVSIAMNFAMPEGERLPSVTTDNTLDAISKGERIATTRWGNAQQRQLGQMRIGEEVSFTAKGREPVTAAVTDVERIRFVPKQRGGPKFIVTSKSTGGTIEFTPEQFFARWSDREGWTVERGKQFFRERIAKGQLDAHQLVFEKTAAEVAPKGGVLEVSTASREQLGKDLSAFNLRVTTPEGIETSVESAYHGAKIWTGPNGEQIGPHPEWADLAPAEAKKLATRIQAKNTLAGFEYGGTSYPADGTSALYDQLYRQGFDAYIQQNPDALDRLLGYSGFTDKFARKGSIAKQNETLQRIVDELRPTKRGTSELSDISSLGDNFDPLHIRHTEMVDDYINRKMWWKQTNPDTGQPFTSRQEFARHLLDQDAAAVAAGAKPRFYESMPIGAKDRARVLGGPDAVRAAVGGSDSAQDAFSAAAAMAEPEAALEDTAGAVSGQGDEDLVASINQIHDDPATPPRKRRILRDARDWVRSKKERVAQAAVASEGEPAAQAAIAVQSQAENAGIMRFMKYPTSDPVETFKRLNNVKVIESASKMVDESAGRLAWLQQSQGYITDADTAAILNQVKKVNTPEGMRTFLKYYDQFMTYIKAWQLTTPGFHVRNMMGGIFNNYLADVDIASTSRFLKNLKKFQNGTLTGDEAEWMKAIYETAGSGQYSHHEIGLAASVGSTYNPLSPRFKALAGSAHFGGDVEFRLRGALMWDRLSKGKSLQEALQDVTRYHFDYSNLSNFETGVVKRIIPFYVWTRYNFPLQIEMMATSPSKYRFYQQFKHTMENRADKGKPVPEFLKNEMFGIPLPAHIGGGQNFLALDLPFTRTMAGATPDVENWDPTKLGSYPTLLDPYASQMAVPLKLPAELALSRQFFKGIPLKDTSKTQGYGIGAYGPAAGALGGSTKADYIAEQLMPVYGQMRRLFPTEKKNKQKLFTNWASYLGAPLRTNTKQDQLNELQRRSYLR